MGAVVVASSHLDTGEERCTVQAPEQFAKLWYKYAQDYRLHMEEHLAPSLTEGQFIVLDYLLDRPQQLVKPSDLLPHLSTTPAAITTLLDRMEKNGLILRKRDDQDRRVVWIMPTDKGKSEGNRGRQVRRQFFEQTLDRLSRHNQQLFVYLFGKVSTASDKD